MWYGPGSQHPGGARLSRSRTTNQQLAGSKVFLRAGVLLCLFVFGCDRGAPMPGFDFDRYVSLQPVALMSDHRTLAGGASFVVEDNLGGVLVAVTPASVWEQPHATPPITSSEAFSAQFVRLELQTYSSPSRTLVSSDLIWGGTGEPADGQDQRENLVLFRVERPVSDEVRVLEMDARVAPVLGEVLFLIVCRSQSGPCQPEAHPVSVSRLFEGGFAGVPDDPHSLHVYSGAPLLTTYGRVAGFYTQLGAGDTPELWFCPTQAIRVRAASR